MADKKYYISKGKALTTKKGILGEGEELTINMVEGAEKKIEALLKAKLITVESPVKVETVKPVEAPKKASGAKK